MTYSRPAEILTWMRVGRLYDPGHLLFVLDVKTYHESWVLWWTACQLSWRTENGWPFSREIDKADWGKLCARGQNRLFLVVMSTAWWAISIKSTNTDEQGAFNEAVDNVQWVIKQVLKLSPSNSDATEDSLSLPVTPTPVPAIFWLICPVDKHQSKPSRRMREAQI